MTTTNPWVRVAITSCVIAVAALVIAFVSVVLNVQRTDDAKAIGIKAKAAAAEAQHAADKAQAATDLLLAQRTESRTTTCAKDKRFADAHNNLVLYLANSKPNPADVRTTSQRASRAALVQDFEAKNLVPVPDCSPEGIAAFYAGHGGTTAVNPPAASPATTAKPAPRTTTTTVRPSTSTSGTTSTTVYPSSTTPTAPPTTCAMVTIPGAIPCP